MEECDNETPACSKCAGAGVECTYPDNVYPTSYVRTLEEKVRRLEARLINDPGKGRQDLDVQSNCPEARSINDDITTQPTPSSIAPANNLAAGVGLLSSCATAEPHYFGSSSGLTLAHFVEAAVQFNNGEERELSLPSLVDRPFSNQVPDAQTPPAPLPSPAEGYRFIEAYMRTIHPIYPFLDLEQLCRLHRKGTEEGAAHTIPPSGLAKLHLVYAIGARCLQLLDSRNVLKDTPEGHYLSAMLHVPEVTRSSHVASIGVTLLLAIHSMRSPAGKSYSSAIYTARLFLIFFAVRGKRLASLRPGDETVSRIGPSSTASRQ